MRDTRAAYIAVALGIRVEGRGAPASTRWTDSQPAGGIDAVRWSSGHRSCRVDRLV